MASRFWLRLVLLLVVGYGGVAACESGEPIQADVRAGRERAQLVDSIAALRAEYQLGRRRLYWQDPGDGVATLVLFLEHVDQFLARPARERGRIRRVSGAHEAAMALWNHYESKGQLATALKYARLATNRYPYPGICGNDETGVLNRLRLANLLATLGEHDEALAIADRLVCYNSPNLKNTVAPRALTLAIRVRVDQLYRADSPDEPTDGLTP